MITVPQLSSKVARKTVADYLPQNIPLHTQSLDVYPNNNNNNNNNNNEFSVISTAFPTSVENVF